MRVAAFANRNAAPSKKAILSYLNASEEDWNNWQWQITHRIQTIEALTALLSLTSEQVNEIKTVSEHFRFAISPYYFSLLDWRSPENDPIAKMSLPDIRELEKKGVSDPLRRNIPIPQAGLYAGILTALLSISQTAVRPFADIASGNESSAHKII